MSAIELIGLAKHWADTTALHAVDLKIEPATFCVLLGPSGCGKSTTLRIIAGLEVASAGRVLIDGRDVTALPPAQRGVAMVFQNYALFPHLTVADNITFGLSVRKMAARERAQRLQRAAELLGLTALLARKPGQLSGGQQQRVALGRALVARAQVCLMDEPLSNLDAQLRQEMRLELRELQQSLGLTVVYVTHDQAEAMSMADQVVLLNQGRVEQNGTPRDIYARPDSVFAARFIGTPPMNLVSVDGGRIAGTPIDAACAGATLGVRPEAISFTANGGGVPATVSSTEYLGADVVLRCQIGSQQLLVRADGRHRAQPGDIVHLHWRPADAHAFDVHGHRMPDPCFHHPDV